MVKVDRRKSPAPANMGTRGLSFWHKVTAQYELRPDELVVLEAACREITLIEQIQAALDPKSMVMKGSMGQPVVNPLVPELRQHRATLKALLAGLKLPDEAAVEVEESRSVQARDAAKSRWAVHHGKAS